jgi:hypothetical protein
MKFISFVRLISLVMAALVLSGCVASIRDNDNRKLHGEYGDHESHQEEQHELYDQYGSYGGF